MIADPVLQTTGVVPGDFGPDFFLITDENDGEVFVFAQSQNDARHRIGRGEVAAHGIEGDPHCGLPGVNSENLATLVVSASRTGDVAENTGATLGTFG